MRLTQIIEALLFASDAPLSAADLARVDERLDEDTVQAVIDELRAEYDATERSFSIYEVAGGYQLLTRPEFVAVLERYETVPQPARLSSPSLEVLAIIAYRQPIGRNEIEEIRGVTSTGPLKTLQDRHLVEAVGRAEGLGRPLLYGTTSKFLEHFGFRSLEDLPRPDELPVVLRSRALDGSAPAEAADAAGAVVPEGEPAPVEHPIPLPESVVDEAAASIAQEASAADPDAVVELQEIEDAREDDVAPEPPLQLPGTDDLEGVEVEVLVVGELEETVAPEDGEPEREP